MKFDRLPLEEAEEAILAHAVDGGSLGRLKKGTRLDKDILSVLKHEGHMTVLAAKLEDGDVIEDDAAASIATCLIGAQTRSKPPFTGRSNLFATAAGVARINKQLLNKINRIDPSITVATVKDFEKVGVDQMLATIKIIPFSTRADYLSRVREETDMDPVPLLEVLPFKRKKIGVISTTLPGTSDKLIRKSERVLEDRLLACDNSLSVRKITEHHEEALSESITQLRKESCALILIFGASAITDTRDVIPLAVEKAGGVIDHFGMPVDPGNLLLLSHIQDTIVIGLPGCTRSPKLNGFDWILERLLADIRVSAEDIMEMGEGGLLKEISSRPQPRAGTPGKSSMSKPKIAVLLLAAGQSRRMGRENKLLALVDEKPMVRRVAEQALASKADHLLMVTGHEADDVLKTVWDLDVPSVQNPDFADGLSTSLKLGFRVLQDQYDGILVCLGDMPFVTTDIFDQLIDAFDPVEGRAIIIPATDGKRGNPALLSSQFKDDIREITGDMGAKALIEENEPLVHAVEIDSSSIFADIDTPEILARVTGQHTSGSNDA
ncbi:MAG: molybdopterin-binding/glycosyltransferase family 2 protein [Sneathiella sp.]